MARIAVIGAGRIGGTLGDAWRRAGHDVTFGVRHAAGRDQGGRRFSTPEAAVQSADVVAFAIPGPSMDAIVPELSGDLIGRIVIDATNRFDTPKAHNEALQHLASVDTPVYRAFNSLGVENFQDPRYGADVADLFFAGTEGRGRSVVESLISDVGLRPIYVGQDPDLVDSVLRLWFALTTERKSRDLAFKLLTR